MASCGRLSFRTRPETDPCRQVGGVCLEPMPKNTLRLVGAAGLTELLAQLIKNARPGISLESRFDLRNTTVVFLFCHSPGLKPKDVRGGRAAAPGV